MATVTQAFLTLGEVTLQATFDDANAIVPVDERGLGGDEYADCLFDEFTLVNETGLPYLVELWTSVDRQVWRKGSYTETTSFYPDERASKLGDIGRISVVEDRAALGE